MIIFKDNTEEIPWTPENINKYKAKNNLLSHAMTGKDVSGIILVLKKTKDLVGYIAWRGNYIVAFEVQEKHRGQGYGEKLLGRAIDNGCIYLSVKKTNYPALKLYKKFGFKENKELKKGKIIEMKLHGSLEEREYAIIPDLFKYKKSGIRRVVKKNIGETRRRLADKALEKARKAAAMDMAAQSKVKEVERQLQNTPGTKEEYRKLKDHLKNKENYYIIDNPRARIGCDRIGNNRAFTFSNPKEAIQNTQKRIQEKEGISKKTKRRFRSDSTNKGYYDLVKYGEGKTGIIVTTGQCKDPATLAHEYGHNINRLNNSVSSKFRDKTKDGSILKDIAVLNEEVGASKKGLGKMKKILGRKPTELEKLNLNAAADTYKYSAKKNFWEKVADKVNIPSRKSTADTSFAGYTRKEQLAMLPWTGRSLGTFKIKGVVGRARVPVQQYPIVSYKPTQFIK